MNTRALSLLVLFAGCAGEEVGTPAKEPRRIYEEEMPPLPDDHPDVGSLGVLSRGPRRLSVPQIERTLEVITGFPEGSIVLDGNLARSLGEPNYLRVTEESLVPSPLFMKFLMDVAGFVCPAVREADNSRPESEVVLARFPDPDENIRYLLLRFLSLDGAAADGYASRLRVVYDAAGATNPSDGWQAVCVALITSPEFLLY